MKRFSILSLFVVALCCMPAMAQDIILLNQDGEKVGVAKDVEKKTVVEEAVKPKATADAKPEKGSATLKNGVITVVGPDGKVTEFNMSDARSVTVTRSSKTVVDENGERKRESVNKAIVIGPHGIRREIDLGSGGNGGMVSESKAPKTWMIGASCREASTVLRAQLRLPEGMGLVVTQVLRGSAAAQAGLQVNDVLMFADQTRLENRKQLTDFVNEAGAAGNEIPFTLLRGGDEIKVTVTPTEREGVTDVMAELGPRLGGFGMDMPVFGGDMDFEFKQFGPGIIIGRGAGGAGIDVEKMHREMMGDIETRMKRMREEMKEIQRRMKDRR